MTLRIAIIGAGAAGLMTAIEAGKKRHQVHIFDHAKKPAEKIRISGGGRCNFTNKYCSFENFTSQNLHFCKGPLARYPASEFISMVQGHQISYHEKHPEKKTGQLFCDGKSQAIIDMLLEECAHVQAQIFLETPIDEITKDKELFTLQLKGENWVYDRVIIATGGPSIPKMGASDFGYRIARQFGHKIVPTHPALVPLTFTDEVLNFTKSLSGVAIDSVLIRSKTNHFRDDLLFTHRGLSGPAILQISSYWNAGEELEINLLPDIDLMNEFKKTKAVSPKIKIHTFLSRYLPARFIEEMLNRILDDENCQKNISDLSDKKFQVIIDHVQKWIVKPNGSEGYRTAEVTRGGVNTDEIDNKTFESKKCAGLYFVGEVLDVTGHLGGHNFQWAWASGYCCGSEI